MSRRLTLQDNSGIVSLDGASAYDLVFDPTNAEARYRLNSSGIEQSYISDDLFYTNIGTWLVSGTNSQFEVRATETSGTVSTGTVGSWLVLSTSREWTVARTTIGTKSVTLTIEIRKASTGVIVATATAQLDAEVD